VYWGGALQARYFGSQARYFESANWPICSTKLTKWIFSAPGLKIPNLHFTKVFALWGPKPFLYINMGRCASNFFQKNFFKKKYFCQKNKT
jgi:hypothetical protein